MLLETKVVAVPAQREIDADLNEYGHIGNKLRGAYGQAACEVGCPDRGAVDERTSAVDAIANILHYLVEHDVIDSSEVQLVRLDVRRVAESAMDHFEAERYR